MIIAPPSPFTTLCWLEVGFWPVKTIHGNKFGFFVDQAGQVNFRGKCIFSYRRDQICHLVWGSRHLLIFNIKTRLVFVDVGVISKGSCLRSDSGGFASALTGGSSGASVDGGEGGLAGSGARTGGSSSSLVTLAFLDLAWPLSERL